MSTKKLQILGSFGSSDADTLQGHPASDFATPAFVANKIAEAQLDGGDVDLSGYATKDELNDLTAADVGAASETHSHSASDITSGTLPLERGGTGSSTALANAPANAILRKPTDGSYIYYTATNNGALYATSENGFPKFGTLPVEQGGTGATTADAARGNLQAVRIDLLWTNASPTSEFPEQTLNLGLSSYSAYIIVARRYTSSTSATSVMQKTGGSAVLSLASYDTEPVVYTRAVDYTSGSLKFYDAWNNTAKDSTVLIPMYIYGIKGVQY